MVAAWISYKLSQLMQTTCDWIQKLLSRLEEPNVLVPWLLEALLPPVRSYYPRLDYDESYGNEENISSPFPINDSLPSSLCIYTETHRGIRRKRDLYSTPVPKIWRLQRHTENKQGVAVYNPQHHSILDILQSCIHHYLTGHPIFCVIVVLLGYFVIFTTRRLKRRANRNKEHSERVTASYLKAQIERLSGVLEGNILERQGKLNSAVVNGLQDTSRNILKYLQDSLIFMKNMNAKASRKCQTFALEDDTKILTSDDILHYLQQLINVYKNIQELKYEFECVRKEIACTVDSLENLCKALKTEEQLTTGLLREVVSYSHNLIEAHGHPHVDMHFDNHQRSLSRKLQNLQISSFIGNEF